MPYILVISEEKDVSVNKVMHWLIHIGKYDVFRINETDKVEVVDISISPDTVSEFKIVINESMTICSTDIATFWYRRGELSFSRVLPPGNQNNIHISKTLESFNRYYYEEWQHVTEYLYYLLKQSNIKSINSWFDLKVNKLINLEEAKKAGLNVPETIVTNDIDKIRRFIETHNKVIAKPVTRNGDFYKTNDVNFAYTFFTKIFTIAELDLVASYTNSFQPSLFQKYTEKDFEIRSFYICGDFYSMAIFSQSNPQTKLDFRNYDRVNPNRCEPFKLPEDIEQNLHRFMLSMSYDSGSFDIIYNNGQYTFLEVNTVGQFDFVSQYCNYQIEKKIAYEIVRRAGA